jgi:hypothetical protein
MIFAITIFVAGCNDLFGSNSDNSQSSDTESIQEEQINVTVSHGDPLPNGTLQDKLFAISQRIDKNVIYDIAIDGDASYSPLIVRTQGKNVSVKIYSTSQAIRTLSLNSQGSLFNVGANATLILENIIIKGLQNNNKALISVNEGGTLIILDGTSIKDNHNDNTNGYDGGGIYVGNDSKFFMKGGEICNNYCNGGGGGVYLRGVFNMSAGSIYNNEAEITNYGTGGGVCIFLSTFIMNGGEIASNSAWRGGGVYIYGKFVKEPFPNEMKSGIIWGYPGNGKENYANGAAVHWLWYGLSDSSRDQNGTFGEYNSINTDLGHDWLFQ